MNNIDQGRTYPVFTLKPEDIAALQKKNLFSKIISFIAVPSALIIPGVSISLFGADPEHLLPVLLLTSSACGILVFAGYYMQRTRRRDLAEGRKYVICGDIAEKIKEPLEPGSLRGRKRAGKEYSYSFLLDDGYRLYVPESEFIHFCEGDRIRASKTVQSRFLLSILKE